MLYSRSLSNPTNLLNSFPQWVLFSVFNRKMCRKEVGSHCLGKYCPQEYDNCSHSYVYVGMFMVGSGAVVVGSAGVFEEAATSEWEIDEVTQLLYKWRGLCLPPKTVITWDSAAHSREDLFLQTSIWCSALRSHQWVLTDELSQKKKILLFKKSPVCKFCLPMEWTNFCISVLRSGTSHRCIWT